MPTQAFSPIDNAGVWPICEKSHILPAWKRAREQALSRCRDCGCAWFPRGDSSIEAVRGQYLENRTSPIEYYQLAERFSMEAFEVRMRRIIRETGSESGSILD